jgi:hypothetical protein
MTTENSGPYLIAALLCEKVLQEKDEVFSVIRIVDHVTITASTFDAPETMPPTPINLNALISLKSGSARGKDVIRWKVEAPSGLKIAEQSVPILFEGEDRGANLILNINMSVDQEGLYWFDLLLEDHLLTRIPLRILYQRIGLSL